MRANWLWSAGIAVVTLVLSFLVLDSDALEVSDQVASVVSCLIALATAVITLVARREAAPDPEERLRSAAHELARRVARQWSREAAARGLLQGDPLRVRWASTARAVQPAASEIAGPGVTRLKLHGDVLGIAGAFRQLPQRRLVVIGAPGAGKSSLAALLVNGLLDDPVEGEAVPVLLNISGWKPAEPLDAWLSRQVSDQHPFLGARTAATLIERDLILPILDGLDEVPPALRPEAIAALGVAMGGKRPFVLTCRAREYEELMALTGTPLARAAVVEIEPVGSADVAEYLPTGQIDGARRWAGVIAELTAHPHGELAAALVTPLMVYLARTVYHHPKSDPAELVTLGDRTAVEQHLLGAYLSAVYRRRPGLPVSGSREVPPEKAEAWLAFLAKGLSRGGVSELAWWRLPSAVRHIVPTRLRPRPGPALLSAVVSVFVVWVLSRFLPEKAVIAVGGIAAGVFMTLLLNGKDSNPDLETPRASVRADRLMFGISMTLSPGLLTIGLAGGLRHWHGGYLVGAGAGLTIAVVFVLIGVPGAAWARFCLARATYAARGQLPLRLMTFLEDAHRRGVLRQVGAVYQFRHARLQEYLAGD